MSLSWGNEALQLLDWTTARRLGLRRLYFQSGGWKLSRGSDFKNCLYK